ncbi:MAG TPA: CHAD domain-containing protein [Candidatus Limnocylindrales bacterium]|nr:CHAD domain-containing protein [Candidatus Limnocylindrales bacterium]
MADPLEVELKYAVRDRAALEAALSGERLGGLVVGPWRTVEMLDRHLDTAGAAVRRRGFAARLRRTGQETIISLKGAALEDVAPRQARDAADGGALHRRAEIEGPASEALDPTAWPASEARDRLLAMIGDAPLRVRFTLRQTRHERELRGIDGWALLSLDEVSVDADGHHLGDLEMLEVEAKGGQDSILEPVARELADCHAVTPEPRTKAAWADLLLRQAGLAGDEDGGADGRGPEHDTGAEGTSDAPHHAGADRSGVEPGSDANLEAAAEPSEVEVGAAGGGEAGAGVEAGAGAEAGSDAPVRLVVGRSPGIRPDDTLAEAGRKALRFQLAKLLDREAELRTDEDPEIVHQARVATRRLRAIWRVFGDGFTNRARRRHVRELRRVAARLGAVRDLDVLLAGLEAFSAAARPVDREAIGSLRESWQARRAAARRALLATLDGPAYRRFRADHLAFVETAGAGARDLPATSPARVRDTAASRIWSAYEALRAYDGSLRWADLETLHAMRMAAKRLRYALEAFREVLGPETSGLIERVVALQDLLGALHDADVAAGAARAFLTANAAASSSASIEAVGHYLGSQEREVARLRRQLPATWRPIVAPAFRRALGRAVSSL